jgi:hypothetical protein
VGPWQVFYQSDLQGVWALLPVPALFLLQRLVAGRGPDARVDACGAFVERWARVFAVVTLLDPLATGPAVRALGLAGAPLGTAVMLCFVLLGDFRVFLLGLFLARPGAGLPGTLRRAALLTAAVPLFAFAADAAIGLLRPDRPGQVLWLVYELAFAALAAGFLRRTLPSRVSDPHVRRVLRRVASYVALYYGLWAAADVLILGGLDAGWGLRILPNQLYYAFFVPFVHRAFLRERGGSGRA